jgi:hypothetical protein
MAKNVPLQTPYGIEAIQQALITGFARELPYINMRLLAPKAVIYAMQYPQ